MKFKFKLLPLSIAAATLSMGVIHTAQAQEQIVKIGHTGPLSGANAFAGKDNENGIRMAVDELNTKKLVVGGKTLKFEMVSEWIFSRIIISPFLFGNQYICYPFSRVFLGNQVA